MSESRGCAIPRAARSSKWIRAITRFAPSTRSSVAAEIAARTRLLRRAGVDEIPLETGKQVIEPILQFFNTRDTRLRSR